MSLEIGSVLEGKVTGITNFGAFVLLPDGTTGLCHISEVAHGYVKEVAQHLETNQTVKVKIISVDERGKISLSIRQTEPKPEPVYRTQEPYYPKENFEDMLAGFMKDSNEKQRELKRALSANKKRSNQGGKR